MNPRCDTPAKHRSLRGSAKYGGQIAYSSGCDNHCEKAKEEKGELKTTNSQSCMQ